MGGVGGVPRWRSVLLAALLAAGCQTGQGEDGERSVPEDEETPRTEAQGLCKPGPSPMRRLTKREYNNTVRDLLGDTTAPANAFPPEDDWQGFTHIAAMQSISPVLAEQYLLAAEGVSTRAVKDLRRLLPCDPAATGEDACARQFLRDFGPRAFRRPLTSDEAAWLQGVYDDTRRGGGDLRAGLAAVIQVALLSPDFLYRLEDGTPVEGRDGVLQLTGYEVASRLSYLLWGTMPDEALFTAAREGRLDTAEGVAAQARRMIADVRARETVREFHAAWLQFGRISELAKDSTTFPAWKPELREHLRAEADALVDHVVWETDGNLLQLFTAPYTFVDDTLAAYYGLPTTGKPGLRKVELPGRAAGLLSQGGLMAVLAKPNETSPVLRGKFVRERLMCQTILPPPDNVVTAPDTDPQAPARERMAQHLTQPSCNGCHVLMDPIGFGFERYQADGRYRERERDGSPVDDSGEVVGSRDGKFKGVAELGARLAADPKVHACVTTNWFRFAQGRAETRDDDCTLKALEEAFARSNGRIPDLLLTLTQTEAFRYRSAPSTQAATPPGGQP